MDENKIVEYKYSKKILIPIGRKCDIAHNLRNYNLRKQAFPFDWTIVSISTALALIKNRFKGFLEEENLVFLKPIAGRALNKNNELVVNKNINEIPVLRTPVVCKKFNMLFTHDFSEKGILDLPIVKEKYDKRISRLLKIIDEKRDIVFLYDNRDLYKEHYPIFESVGIDFKTIESKDNIKALQSNFNFPIKSFTKYIWIKLPSVFTIPSN